MAQVLNKRKLKPGDQPVALADGDVLTVGDATFKFFGSVKVRPRHILQRPPTAVGRHTTCDVERRGGGPTLASVFQV